VPYQRHAVKLFYRSGNFQHSPLLPQRDESWISNPTNVQVATGCGLPGAGCTCASPETREKNIFRRDSHMNSAQRSE
jgi:hypothetical protein